VNLELQLFGRSFALNTKALPPLKGLTPSGQGWYPWGVVRESFTGAWQRNIELRADTALSYFAVWACTRLITTDMGKMCLRLVQQDADGIWTETSSPAFSPVLRKPNRYQTINKFVESWILSKLNYGNAYVLKVRDQRRVVVEMHVLDPSRVKPLVAMDGAVYYELQRDDLSGIRPETVTVPASEIIHDTYIAPFHPLIGLSPLFACSSAVTQGLAIQGSSTNFFQNSNTPSGILTAPKGITSEQAAELLKTWKARQPGDIAVLGGELAYTSLGFTAVESQVSELSRLTAEQVCSAYGVPPYLVDIGPPPPYANFEPLLLKYHSQCIQSLATNFEKSLDEGLGLLDKIDGTQYGTEFDVDDLIWMDTATRVESASKSIQGGGMSPNEARKKYHGLGKVEGGETPLLQNQMWPLAQLADRETPSAPDLPAMPVVDDQEPESDTMEEAASFASILHRKAIAEGLYAG